MEPIGMEARDGIAVLRLQHGKASAMDAELCRAIVRRVDECAAAPEVRAAVVVGTGRIFSAGVDLVKLTESGEAYAAEFVPLLVSAVTALFALEKPVVAAVNGHAVAGGCVIACTADVRLMAAGPGRIGVPELLVGVPFPTAALEIVRYAVAPQHLQSVVYGGATYGPEEARALGLVDEVVDPADLEERALAAAGRLAALDRHVFATTKRQLRSLAFERMNRGAEEFDPVVREVWKMPETLERIRSYVERTLRRRDAG